MLNNMIFLLFCFPDGCSQWLHPRKHVVCYFEGKRSVTSLNACLCTHLIYTNVGLNPEAKLDITNGKSSKVFNYCQKSPISVQIILENMLYVNLRANDR